MFLGILDPECLQHRTAVRSLQKTRGWSPLGILSGRNADTRTVGHGVDGGYKRGFEEVYGHAFFVGIVGIRINVARRQREVRCL